MTSCAVNTSLAPQGILKYNEGGGCTLNTDSPPTHRLAPTPVTGYPLYSHSKSGFYLVIGQEAINYVRNPTFKKSLNTWDASNVSARRTNSFSFDSGFSISLRGSGDTSDPLVTRAYVETEIDGFIPGSNFVASGYVWLPVIYDNQDLLIGTISIVQLDGADVEISELVSSQVSKVQRWQRIALSFRIDQNTERLLLRLNLRSQTKRRLYPPYDEILNDNGDAIFNDKGEYAYFDMIQLEQGVEPTTPFHGDTFYCESSDCDDDYTWESVAHESASFRSECTRTGGRLVSLTDLGFNILSHSGHDGVGVTNIAQPYSNKPGSNYQKTVADSSRNLTFTSYTCGCSLDALCNTFRLKSQILPNIGQCKGKFLLVYRHDPDECPNNCDEERDLAMCVVYSGGFEYARDNLYQQNIVLQFQAHDPLAWFAYPGESSIELDFVRTVRANRVLKLGQDGEAMGFPIDTGKDITGLACLPGTNEFVIGGDFDQINSITDATNIALFSCTEYCDVGRVGSVNVVKSTSVGHVIFGGNKGPHILYSDNGQVFQFDGYPGGEVWAIEKPFWGNIAAGDDTGIYVQKDDGSWLTWSTNGRVLDLQQDNFGNLYATGEFTLIDGQSFNRVARLNVNSTGCLDVDNAAWESIGFGFDGSMNTIELDPKTNSLYFGGNADFAIPDSVDICNDVIGRSTDSKSKGNECTFLYDTPMLFAIDGSNPQTIESGGSPLCSMDFTIRTSGNFLSFGTAQNPQITGLANGSNALTIHFPFPVTNLILVLRGMDTGEGFSNFNILPTSEQGFDVVNGNFYRSNVNPEKILTWDGPITDLTFNWFVFDAGANNGSIEWERMTFNHPTGGNNQQFTFIDLGGGQTRFEVALSNPIAQQFLFTCLNDAVTTLQKRYVRISSTNTKGILYNFLIGDDNIFNLEQYQAAGMYVVRMDVNSTSAFPEPCATLNTSFSDEFTQSQEDLEIYKTLTLTGGLGVDNILSTIKIQCITLDVTFQGDNVAINKVACLNGQNLTGLGDGFTTEVYKLLLNPNTGELWAGYDGGLRIWNGQAWFDFPGVISGSVIDMDSCKGDIYLLTNSDGAHILPAKTDLSYFGDFETLGRLEIQGPANLEFIGENCDSKIARFCAQIECDETGVLDLSSGNFSGSRDFNSTVLGGSRLDFWMKKCGQSLNMYISGDSATTKATMIYKDHFWGIDAICCAGKGSGLLGTADSQNEPENADCCQYAFNQHRDPTNEDCITEGWEAGDTWLSNDINCGVPQLFINTGAGCCDQCNPGALSFNGNLLLDQDGNPISA